MIYERELENLIERIPAAPDRLFVMRYYTANEPAAFETHWREAAALQLAQDGAIFQRLHRDLEQPGRYVSYDLWESPSALGQAIRNTIDAITLPDPAQQIFVRLIDPVPGQLRDFKGVRSGQAITVRHFSLKVGTEQEFEQLWSESARAEARQSDCLTKILHRDLHLPTHYVSYSVWTSPAAANHAASQHSHWQHDHKPYPLAGPVERELFEVAEALIARS